MYGSYPRFYVLLAAVVLGFSTIVKASHFTECLENIRSQTSKLTVPSSDSYATDRQGFNLAFDYFPAAIYHAATNEDASAAIKCAQQFRVPIAPRSGGHSYEGYSEGGRNGSLVIDLNLRQEFSLNVTSGIATVGGGVRLGVLYTKLWEAGGYLAPAGTCPTVGIGGHGLGGGYGLVARKHGMLTHNIVGMTVIDASGEERQVDATSNADLFWALRGAGGGSFGLVTQFRIQAYKAPQTVTTYLLSIGSDNYTQTFEVFHKMADDAPAELTLVMNIGKDGINVQGTYLGPRSDGDTPMSELLQLAGDEEGSRDVKEVTWFEAAKQWAWLNNGTLANPVIGDSRLARGRSLLWRHPLSSKEQSIIREHVRNPPKEATAAYVIMGIWGGEVDGVYPPSAFDFHQGVKYSAEFVTEWDEAQAQSPCLSWSAAFIKEMRSAYSSGPDIEAYQNYIERDLPDSWRAYYGESGFERLQKALARAVYSRARVVILDHVTSGLDLKTTTFLLERLFSESGCFRRAGIAVILVTHYEPLLACMDNMILLENGQVTGQGSYVSLRPGVAEPLQEDQGGSKNECDVSLMQSIIDQDFPDCTVILVLHRFAYIYRYDRILVMDQGRLIEVGTPEELINGSEDLATPRASSAFSRLFHAKL